MAKVFASPIPAPTIRFETREQYFRDEKTWLDSLRDWCKLNGKGELRGEEIKTPVADGYARYMVLTSTPLQVIHIPLGDGYRAGAIWERGLRVSDVRAMAKQERAWDAIFAKK